MYQTSRKAQSAFSQRGRDIITSRKAERRFKQQEQLFLKQNELDIEQIHLIQKLSIDMIEEGRGEYF